MELKPLTALLFTVMASSAVFAQEYGRVLSSTAQVQQVTAPRTVCATEQVTVQDPKSGAGAIMGAIAGGAIGNQIGRGAGNAVATMLGVVGGAIAGDRIEGAGASRTEPIQRCTTQNTVENRITGYTVVYEYAGRRYSVQMPNDPGPTIPLQVVPMGGSAPAQPLGYSAPLSYNAPANYGGVYAESTEVRRVPSRQAFSPEVVSAANMGLMVGAGALVGYGVTSLANPHGHWRH